MAASYSASVEGLRESIADVLGIDVILVATEVLASEIV
jgi:hypothetical protein